MPSNERGPLRPLEMRSVDSPDRRRLLTGGAALALAACVGGCNERKRNLQIRGSDSEVNLVQRMAERFMESHRDVAVAVTGGGSGVGIATLIDGRVDIANSSRGLSAREKLLAMRKGVDPVATLFATDALTVIVNEQNPVAELKVEDVGAMFAGKLQSWSKVGGKGEVVAYGRQSSSGTHKFFRDAVVRGEYGRNVREMSGNGQIVEGVARDPGGVGYVAVGYLRSGAKGIKAAKILGRDAKQAVSPLDEPAVLRGEYPIARPLYQYTDGVPEGALRDFLLFELSPEGEAICKAMGFYPLVSAWRERNAHLRKGRSAGG